MTQVPSLPSAADRPQGTYAAPDAPPKPQPASPGAAASDRLQRLLTGRSLREQLLTTVLPLALAPLLVASLISYGLTQRRTRATLNQDLQGQAVLSAETVANNINEVITFASTFAENPFILDKARRDRTLTAQEKLGDIPEERLEARFILNKQLAPNPTVNGYLAQTATLQNFAEIIVTEANGLNIGYSALPSDFVQAGEDWWEQARQGNRWFSQPDYDASTFQVGVNFSFPLQDPQSNDFLGAVKFFITALEFDLLNQYLANAGLQGTQQVQLLEPRSQYVLAAFTEQGQDIALTPRSLDLAGGEVVAGVANTVLDALQADAPVAEDALRQQIAAAPVSNVEIRVLSTDAEALANVVVAFTHQGRRYAMANVPNLNWMAIASMETAEIRAAGRGNLVVLGLLGLALGGIAAAFAGVVSQQLSSPLNDLARQAQAMAQGNLDVQAQPAGSSETHTLAYTFNDLVLRVRTFLAEQQLSTQQANLAAAITGAKVVNTAELQPVLQRVVDESRSLLQADRVVIYQFGPDGSGSIVAEAVLAGLPSALEQNLSDPCIPEATRQKYLNDGILLETNIETADFHPEHLALVRSLNVQSMLGVPVVSQGQLSGLLIAHHCRAIHPWQDREVTFMKQLGLQLGLVVERVKLLEQTQALAEEQRQIKEGLQRNALKLLMDVDPVSQGNLTVRAQVTEDEIGTVADSYNATIASLRKIVVQVQEASRQVTATTEDNQTSVRTLADSATQQADTILAALDRIQEMADSVRLVATNAEKAEAAVLQAEQTVAQGDDAMTRTVEGILAIRETVADTAKKVKRLGESSQKISNVVNLISGFAAQTNMLALNASIEASRAGEGGRGFAVVAEEVRELARQSAEATTEIEKLVASIQAETNAVVAAMESGTEQVVTGTQLVDETRQSLNQITAVSRQISQLVAAIADATVAQTQSSEVVTATMTTVAATSSENAAAANQVSDSFAQLKAVAQALQEEVGRFQVS